MNVFAVYIGSERTNTAERIQRYALPCRPPVHGLNVKIGRSHEEGINFRNERMNPYRFRTVSIAYSNSNVF